MRFVAIGLKTPVACAPTARFVEQLCQRKTDAHRQRTHVQDNVGNVGQIDIIKSGGRLTAGDNVCLIVGENLDLKLRRRVEQIGALLE